MKTDVLFDEVRAGGRIPLIIGRGLTTRARAALGLPPTDAFRSLAPVVSDAKGFTLAQKMVGRACGREGVLPGEYCEPLMTTVGSQDTTVRREGQSRDCIVSTPITPTDCRVP